MPLQCQSPFRSDHHLPGQRWTEEPSGEGAGVSDEAMGALGMGSSSTRLNSRDGHRCASASSCRVFFVTLSDIYWKVLPHAERDDSEAKAVVAQAQDKKHYPDWHFRTAVVKTPPHVHASAVSRYDRST